MAMECPICGSEEFNHDEWEDMYRCSECELFWYPEEIGFTTNPTAPIFKL